MKRDRIVALLTLLLAPLSLTPRSCTRSAPSLSAAQSGCMEHYIQQGTVNSSNYQYYLQVCRQQAP